MAVKACIECGEMVSEDAKLCPHCGKKDPTETIGDKIGQFVVGVIIFVGIMWWSPWSSDDKVEQKKELQKSPVKIKVVQAYNSAYNYYYPKVIITSLVDTLKVTNVITNKGNCKPTFREETRASLGYGGNMEVRYKKCEVMLVKVITDKGDWSVKY